MKSSDDDCWRLAGECSRWAEEAQDKATREAFRQMAKVWSQLAFGYHFKLPSEKATRENDSASDARSSSPAR
jgi:ferric-dicitrate binding protein FerR (iron transport regulator)